MSLLQMTLAGGAMVLAVVLARALLLNRLPKATFIALWALVAVRLLVPVSIPSPWSAASLLQGIVPAPAAIAALDPAYDARSARTDSLGENPTASDGVLAASDAPAMNPLTPTTSPATPTTTPGASASPAAENPATPDAVPTATDPMNPTASTAPAESDAPDAPVAENPRTFEAFSAALPVVWAVGSVLCAAGFAAVYLRCRRDFATSLPVDDPRAQAWLAENRSQLRRPLSLRRSDLISTSLTYGVLRPVILVPRDTDWSREGEVRYMLAHELVHVRRFDALTKLVLVACVCVHWFNPLVWAMYVLANRDLELSCDECVVRGFGTGSRAEYARTLIAMEETKSGLAPLYSGFSKTATEERIVAIMHIKKTSLLAVATSASLVVGIPAALATSAAPQTPVQPDDRPAAVASLAPVAPVAASSSFDTSDWASVTSSTYYSADDWALVQALNVPGVEDLTVAEFTDLALTVADTPEKLDTLMLFMDDADIAEQASTNGAARFVSGVMAPTLLDSSRFPTTAANDGNADAHWSGTVTLVSTDAVVSADGQAVPSALANALAEGGYSGGEMCYMMNAHVLDADALTVGEYVQTIEDTRSAVNALADWDLAPSWDRDAGEKLTAALDDIAQNASSDDLLVEATWFFVDNADGQVTLSDAWGSTGDAAGAVTALQESLTTYGATLDDGDSDITAALLDSYAPLGLSYEMNPLDDAHMLTMEYGGLPVRSVYDERRGIWIANSMNEFRFGDTGIDLVAVYDGDQLVELREASDDEQSDLDERRVALTVAAESEVTTVSLTQEDDATVEGKTPAAVPGSAEEFDALIVSYAPFDLVYDETTGTYYYQEEPVRYLFDGQVLEMNDDGTAASYVTANDYYSADGTVDVYVVRETERGVDGSVSYMGDVIGVEKFSKGQDALLRGLIDGCLLRGGTAQTTAVEGDAVETAKGLSARNGAPELVAGDGAEQEVPAATAEGNTSSARGLTVADRLKPFEKYGLTYRDGNLWHGSDPVNAFVDMNDGGVFSYGSSDQYTNGLYLRAVYDEDGKLTGLKEFDPTAVFGEE